MKFVITTTTATSNAIVALLQAAQDVLTAQLRQDIDAKLQMSLLMDHPVQRFAVMATTMLKELNVMMET